MLLRIHTVLVGDSDTGNESRCLRDTAWKQAGPQTTLDITIGLGAFLLVTSHVGGYMLGMAWIRNLKRPAPALDGNLVVHLRHQLLGFVNHPS